MSYIEEKGTGYVRLALGQIPVAARSETLPLVCRCCRRADNGVVSTRYTADGNATAATAATADGNATPDGNPNAAKEGNPNAAKEAVAIVFTQRFRSSSAESAGHTHV